MFQSCLLFYAGARQSTATEMKSCMDGKGTFRRQKQNQHIERLLNSSWLEYFSREKVTPTKILKCITELWARCLMRPEVVKATAPADQVSTPEKKSYWYVSLSRDCDQHISVVDESFLDNWNIFFIAEKETEQVEEEESYFGVGSMRQSTHNKVNGRSLVLSRWVYFRRVH